MLCLFCSDRYSCPYIIQHHKITEIVVFNVHAQLLSGTAVGRIHFFRGLAEKYCIRPLCSTVHYLAASSRVLEDTGLRL